MSAQMSAQMSVPLVMEETESEGSSDLAQGPALFLCSSCRLPLGDSGDCVGKGEDDDDDDIILLKAVTEYVEIDEELAVSSYKQDSFSTVQLLICKGCTAMLGALYVATPVHLDYKRDLFILNTSSVSCYSFNHANKQTRINQKPVSLPNVSYMDAQLKKCKTVFGFCERAVTEMEKLFQSSEGP